MSGEGIKVHAVLTFRLEVWQFKHDWVVLFRRLRVARL